MAIAAGEKMYADDILNLLFFPKGLILQYDGTSWQDNVTLKGWYQCAGQETPYGATPDLRSKFIMGYDGGGRTGGNNSLELSTANLPAHGHSLNNMSLSGLTVSQSGAHLHSGSGTTNSGSGGHTHNVSGNTNSTSKSLTGYFSGNENSTVSSQSATGVFSFEGANSYSGIKDGDRDNQRTYMDATHSHGITGSTSENGGTHVHDVNVTIPESGTHSHTITGGAISGSVGSAGLGAAFDNRPGYYALIYIIKMTPAGN